MNGWWMALIVVGSYVAGVASTFGAVLWIFHDFPG